MAVGYRLQAVGFSHTAVSIGLVIIQVLIKTRLCSVYFGNPKLPGAASIPQPDLQGIGKGELFSQVNSFVYHPVQSFLHFGILGG